MKIFEGIDTKLADWIRAQALFFVGTAPTGAEGHVNVSPKGPIGSLRISGPLEVAYLDHLGSGSETIAHLRENGRICVMLCAFNGPPRIVRLHGRGAVVQVGTPVSPVRVPNVPRRPLTTSTTFVPSPSSQGA